MKTFLSSISLLSLLLCSCATQEPENPVLCIEGGQVQGVVLNNSVVYRGIPYAAPPVDSLRWQLPQPVVTWDSVLIADHWSCASWQAPHDPNDANYGVEFYAQDPEFSEDCLYLNIWTPRGASGHSDRDLPVALWIHGGAYHAGWGFEPEFDGEAWAERGVILVTINYRLGIFGFLTHPELTAHSPEGISGNYGIYDQLKAIQWVHDNIAQFGGNPDNITIFGQSAGGGSVRCLVSSPLAKPLISKAIIMSAGGLNRALSADNTQQSAEELHRQILDAAGISTYERLMASDWQTLYNAQQEYVSRTGNWRLSTPHIDGRLITTDFSEAALCNTLADIPYMVGSVANDMPGLDKGLEDFASLRDSLSEQPVYVYYFDSAPPTDGRPALTGSFHSSELWSVFHTLGRSWRPFSEADYELSSRMVTYWTNFAKYGDPNTPSSDGAWQPYTNANAYVHKLTRQQ
ncbi:MAG: carboxylesterase family protein [Bacteroidales bacterium]|nr:carboxylesterase family protein [Candidatus Liminaster caballi]